MQIRRHLYSLCIAATAVCALAQEPDALRLKTNNTVLRGYLLPFTCSGTAKHINFQATGSAATAFSMGEVVSIQVGSYLLSANPKAVPGDAATQAMSALIQSDRSTRGGPQIIQYERSLTKSIEKICRLAAAPADSPGGWMFGGRMDVNGTLSSGATIQRLIGGDVTAFWAPLHAATGLVTPTLYYNTSYGDSIKGPVTTKSSEVEDGGAIIAIQAPPVLTGLATSVVLSGDLYHSFSQGLMLKEGYGAGVSQNLSSQFLIEGDLWYDHDTPYIPNRTFSSPAARIYEAFGNGQTGKRVAFTETLSAVLPFDSAKALFLQGTTTLSVALGPAAALASASPPPFTLQISYADDYFRNAPKGFKQNYGKLTLGIGYKWRK